MVWGSVQRHFAVTGISVGANLSPNRMAGHGRACNQMAQLKSLDKYV